MERELRMLAYQTFKAATDSSMPFLCWSKGGAYIPEIYEAFELTSTELIVCLAAGEAASLELREHCFDANRHLRRNYDQYGLVGGKTFDQKYAPLGGWKDYFQRTSSELYLIEQLADIRKQIAEDLPKV